MSLQDDLSTLVNNLSLQVESLSNLDQKSNRLSLDTTLQLRILKVIDSIDSLTLLLETLVLKPILYVKCKKSLDQLLINVSLLYTINQSIMNQLNQSIMNPLMKSLLTTTSLLYSIQ